MSESPQPGTTAAGLGNLAKIEHVVVLMMENRSFDHMLGYLSFEGGRADINGLKPELENDGHAAHHLDRRELTKPEDPDHSSRAVDQQINGGQMNGFVASYTNTLQSRAAALQQAGVPGDPTLVMGYYNAADLPVYDHLAEHFCVCDRWHSSVPGATWPNRLYAVAGRAAGSRDDRAHPSPPIYDQPSFVRHLDAHGVSWRWYSFDPGTLRCVDAEYLIGHRDHFAYVDKRKLRWETETGEAVVIDEDSASFLEDAARGRLPAVSWIDPNFNDLNLFGSASNDDHPPSNVTNGQDLVLRIYRALAASPQWDKTLFITTYDEHGGFFDHVGPPEAPDDDPAMRRYGVRVPALIVSPWIEPRSVSTTLFDHTSIIKTILTRFCPADLKRSGTIEAIRHWLEEGHPHYMGQRVAKANDLGGLLTAADSRPPPDTSQLLSDAEKRHADRAAGTLTATPPTTPMASELTDLQTSMALAAGHLRGKGLLPGHP